ncbi:MAG: insulinase family protein, partial [Lentisphaeria bacterium]|nr:insulinase family protein [Lentisphaeria bacterium]
SRKIALLPRQQAVVFTAVPGVQSGSPDTDVLNLIRTDAASMASKLFQSVRNQNGLVYYAHFTSQSGFGFDGFMGYCGATTADGAPELEKIFREEMRRLAQHGLTETEFENARRMLLFQLENLRQSPEELLSALTSAEFTGSGWRYVWDRKTLLEKMTRTAFNRRVKKLFTGKNTVTSVVLPKPDQGKNSHEN